MKRIWFDTEFIDNGEMVIPHLVSIGLVDSNGSTLYLENDTAPLEEGDKWFQEYVVPYLQNGEHRVTLPEMRRKILDFVGSKKVEFWAYYADWDWVILLKTLFGRMIDAPPNWPHLCFDVKQMLETSNKIPILPKNTQEHHALSDAIWTKELWELNWCHPKKPQTGYVRTKPGT
jgi:hypothetical protein